MRASRPIRSVNWSFERLRTSELAVEDFGSCLFTTSERKSARRFSKRLGGNLPSRFGPKTVVGSMTAANCGPIGSRLLEVTGFTQGPGGSSGGANDGSGNGNGGGNNDGSGGGSTPDGDGGQPPAGDLVPFEGIGASTGAPNEHIVVLTCDEDWTALTIPKFKRNPWTEASTLDGGGACSVGNGNVACTFDAQPGQALLRTSTKAIAVGSSVTSRVGGFPGGSAQNVPVVFKSD